MFCLIHKGSHLALGLSLLRDIWCYGFTQIFYFFLSQFGEFVVSKVLSISSRLTHLLVYSSYYFYNHFYFCQVYTNVPISFLFYFILLCKELNMRSILNTFLSVHILLTRDSVVQQISNVYSCLTETFCPLISNSLFTPFTSSL